MSAVLIIITLVLLLLVAFSTWRAPRLTSIILWSLVATIFFSSAILLKGPGPFSEKALWITIAVPLLWTAFQFWTYWDGKAWRVAAGLISISIISGAIVFLSQPTI